jgi:RNA 2',3'-cyclic 3'-phosphodiesterase
MTLRTFIAVEIDPAVRRVIEGLIEVFRRPQADVKWVAFQNLHITLQFLGDVPEEETATIGRAIADAAAAVAPFELHLRGAGAFPHLGRPRTFWLGCEKGEAQLSDLQRRIEAALSKIGHRPEGRRFQAHLTIGRARGGGPAMGDLGQLFREYAEHTIGQTNVRQITLFSSQLGPQGPRYTPLSVAALRGT